MFRPLSGVTADRAPVAEARVNRDLATIAGFLAARRRDLVALVLVGGFGRGEGVVRAGPRGPEPVNDYDVVVITHTAVETQQLRDWGVALARRVRVRAVDLIHIPSHALRWLPPSMFNHDLRAGGQQFWGESDVLPLLPPLDAPQIPWAEGRALLFNRLVCLLEAFSLDWQGWPPAGEPTFLLAAQSYKAALAAADALLVLKGAYCTRYSEKEQALVQQYPHRGSLAALVRRAVAFRRVPLVPEPDEAWRLWFAARDEVTSALRHVLASEFVWERSLDDWGEIDRLYAGWQAEQRRCLIELAELHLLLAVRLTEAGTAVVEPSAVERARARLRQAGAPAGGGWEALRRASVEAWFRWCH